MAMRMLCLIAAAAAAGACAKTEEVGNTAELEAAASSNAPEAPAAANGADFNTAATDPGAGLGAVEPGQWFERTSPEDRWAGFGPPNSEATFSARCEGEQLVLSTTEVPRSGPGQTTMHLSATGVDESIRATASNEGLPNTEAPVPADAAWLEKLQSASGNLTVSVAGGEALVVPISGPLTSLIGDCRR